MVGSIFQTTSVGTSSLNRIAATSRLLLPVAAGSSRFNRWCCRGHTGQDGLVKREVPPRGAAFDDQPMLLVFDVDCGELIPGHHFIARGLGGPARLSVLDYWDGDNAELEQMLEFEEAGGYPGFSLEYEFVPGVPPPEDGRSFFHYLVGISYKADVGLPWQPNDGGAIAPFEGGATTHGSRGDWPLPPDATVLTFSLASPDPAGFTDPDHPAGDLVVDLVRGAAVWRPA